MGQVAGAALRRRTSTLVFSSSCLLSAGTTCDALTQHCSCKLEGKTYRFDSKDFHGASSLGQVVGAALRWRTSTLVLSSLRLLSTADGTNQL